MLKNSSIEIKEVNKNIIITPKDNIYSNVIIFLHGLGDNPKSYVELFSNEKMLFFPKTKILLLSAPLIPINLYNGEMYSAWFDVIKNKSDDNSNYKFEDVEKNSINIIKIILAEGKKLKGNFNNIFIGGFSQGACIALHIGLTFSNLLGGIICCSGFLFKESEINELNNKIKIFAGHGYVDKVIKCDFTQNSFQRIKNFENFHLKIYHDMEHIIGNEELNDIKKFLDDNLMK